MQEATTTSARRRGKRGLIWLAIASLAAVAMLGSIGGASVLAVHGGNHLAQTLPIDFDDPEFQGDAGECAGSPVGTWHFVLVQTGASSATLTATFESGAVFVVGSTKKTGGTLHFDVPAGDDTLVSASVTATGKALLLSHICGGTTTTTTTTTTVTTTSGTTTTP